MWGGFDGAHTWWQRRGVRVTRADLEFSLLCLFVALCRVSSGRRSLLINVGFSSIISSFPYAELRRFFPCPDPFVVFRIPGDLLCTRN